MSDEIRPTCLECRRSMPTFGSYDYLTLQGRQPRSRYGYDGNGIFCTVSCGYRWAVRRVRQEIDDE